MINQESNACKKKNSGYKIAHFAIFFALAVCMTCYYYFLLKNYSKS